MSQWYYAQDDEQHGPVTAAALKEMAQLGTLGRHDLIWREGMQRWAPAHKVRGLFPATPATDVLPVESDEASAAPAGEGELETSPKKLIVRPSDESPDEPDEETAIDVLPLAGPEESKLQVPTLDAPEDAPSGSPSDDLVVFEPAAPPARPPGEPQPPAVEAAQQRAGRAPSGRQTRVDDAHAPALSWASNVALFLQTFLWVSCLLVIVVGGVVFLSSLITGDPSGRLTASGVYGVSVLAAYFLARGTERICIVLGRWFNTADEAKGRRNLRQRNWKRFQ